MPCGSLFRPEAPRRQRQAHLVVVLVMALLSITACSSGEDSGNQQAFCGLLKDGVGLSASNQTLVDFDNLETVAPVEIRATIARLRNTALDLSEIDPLDVEALFNARFDPNALAARDALNEFAEVQCDLDLESGPPVRADDASAELDQYLDANFKDAPWSDSIDITVGVSSGRLHSIVARYVAAPADLEEPAEVCRALSVYLYSITEGEGTVSVEVDGGVVAFRAGPEASCIAI